MNTTLDGLLDRRVTLEQPAQGYRVAIDTVLLAAAVPIEKGRRALDLGCGVGGAMLCLAARVPGTIATGVEIQSELAQLCCANIARNKFDADLNVLEGDVTQLPFTDEFDHAFMNPPYHDEAWHDVSERAGKRTANAEKHGDLARWIARAAQALKASGCLTVIHRADRLEEILRLLQSGFGAIEVLPIAPKADAPPRRVIIRAHKGAGGAVTRCCNFVLHQADGRYAEEAETVLRHMKVLPFRR